MSVSLIVLRLETSEKSPTLKDIEYQAQSRNCISETSEWPALVSEKLFAIHRGERAPTTITVVSLDEELIELEMAVSSIEKDFLEEQTENPPPVEIKLSNKLKSENSLESNILKENLEIEIKNPKDSSKSDNAFIGTGGIPRQPSKESTPGPSSSKEGTPCLSEDGSGRRSRPFNDNLHFISGNPTVDVTHGILHLFKENTKTSLDPGEMRSEMLCMLAVPTSLSIHDLLQFTAPCYTSIQSMRIIRDNNPNQYMVLIKFRAQSDADLFYTTFNGHPFNSIEPDLCRLVYVARVESTSEMEEGGLPIPGHSELPTCPVCLDRMDESVEGVLTILCNHSFHSECLSKWADTSCPICRFCQTPEGVPEQRCLSCGASDSLWICLICGHVGCGRYVGGHAHRHFMETSHLFSLQVGNNRVWDYVRDNYVHRLLQSEGDGKMVSYERSPASHTDSKEEGERFESEEKLTELQLEYTHMLTSQLESQREFFEAKISEVKRDALSETEESKRLAQQKATELEKMREEAAELKSSKDELDKSLRKLQEKVNAMQQKLAEIEKELDTEKTFNKNLIEGKKYYVAKVEELQEAYNKKEKEVKEMETQVRDVMLHLEASTMMDSNPELQGGCVGVSKATKGHRKHKRN